MARFQITEDRSHHEEGPLESFFGLRVKNELLLNIHIKAKVRLYELEPLEVS